MFLRTQTTAGRTYLLLVENERVDGRIKQRVLHRLGRLDQLQASGQLDSLLASLGRFSDKLAVFGAHGRGESVATRTRRIGAALIFERLWQETGVGAVLHEMLRGRRFEFPLERAVFMTAHFNDRGHSFQAYRGQRFSVIADRSAAREWLCSSYLSCPASV